MLFDRTYRAASQTVVIVTITVLTLDKNNDPGSLRSRRVKDITCCEIYIGIRPMPRCPLEVCS